MLYKWNMSEFAAWNELDLELLRAVIMASIKQLTKVDRSTDRVRLKSRSHSTGFFFPGASPWKPVARPAHAITCSANGSAPDSGR
jgi:hypothetical protein